MIYEHEIEIDLKDYSKNGELIEGESCATLFCESTFDHSTQDIETLFQVYFDEQKIEFDELSKVDQQIILERVNNLTTNEIMNIVNHYYDSKQQHERG